MDTGCLLYTSLMVLKKRIKRSWSFSGLATMVRIMLMYYVNLYTFLEEPDKDWSKLVAEAESPPDVYKRQLYASRACTRGVVSSPRASNTRTEINLTKAPLSAP